MNGRVFDRGVLLEQRPMLVPPIAHFIWYGDRFPWVNVLALQSAHDHGELERVVLHYDGRLPSSLRERLRASMPRLELREMNADATFGSLGILGITLRTLHDELRTPASRANIWRAAVLAVEGGVYLDIDTVTLSSLRPLLSGAFAGSEPIAFPASVMHSRNPLRWARALSLHAARLVLREAPRGFVPFRVIEPLFDHAANNAVIGAPPQHPFMLALLQAMATLPLERRYVRFALGTHLLQQTIGSYTGHDFTLHDSAVFYPLGPEISRHWFYVMPKVLTPVRLDDVLDPRTLIVHWYASVRNAALVDSIDPAFVRAHASRQLFSALALRTPNALRE